MFRFTIRELVLLTLMVAMGAAWWTEHRYAMLLNTEKQLWQTRAHLLRDYLTGPESEVYGVEFTGDRMLITLNKQTKSP